MFKSAVVTKVKQSYLMVNMKAQRDPAYKKFVLENPEEAIYQLTGFRIPSDWKVSIIDKGDRLCLKINDDSWLKRFGLSIKDLQESLGDIIC